MNFVNPLRWGRLEPEKYNAWRCKCPWANNDIAWSVPLDLPAYSKKKNSFWVRVTLYSLYKGNLCHAVGYIYGIYSLLLLKKNCGYIYIYSLDSKCLFIIIYYIVYIYIVAAELKMDVLREREVKDNLERQLLDEQKMRGKCKSYPLKCKTQKLMMKQTI